MKSKLSVPRITVRVPLWLVQRCPWLVVKYAQAKWWVKWAALRLSVLMILPLLASCSSLGRPELQRSPVAPACSQRTPALDSGDPPSEADAWDPFAWAQAYVQAQWAIVDRDNKRAATADCLDKLARIKS